MENMNDEEKKAIDYLQLCYDLSTITNESLSKLGIVLNLIEKQSKEIEELKDESKEYQIGFAQGCYERELDWKDKIKAKIEEVKDGTFDAKIVLQSLLEKE